MENYIRYKMDELIMYTNKLLIFQIFQIFISFQVQEKEKTKENLLLSTLYSPVLRNLIKKTLSC